MKAAQWVYSILLKGYPAAFRGEYGAEMQATFAEALETTSLAGRGARFGLLLHELAEWPGALLREHWNEFQRRRKEVLMTEMVSSLAGGVNGNGGPSQTGSWGEALRAGVPHGLLFCLAAVAMGLQNFPILEEEIALGRTLAILALILFWVIVLGSIGRSLWVAYRAHWPGWAASWYGYVFVLMAVPVLGALQNSDTATRGGWDQMVFGGVFPLILIAWLYWLVRKDGVKALLMATPFAIVLWMPVGEFVPGPIRNPLNLWMLAMVAGVAVTVMRVGWRKGLWGAALGSLSVGLPITYARTFHAIGPDGQVMQGNWAEMGNLLASTGFWSLSLMVGPLVLGVLREAGQRLGGHGKRGVQILLGGLALSLLGTLFLLQLRVARLTMNFMGGWQVPLSIVALVGMAGMVIGAVILVRAVAASENASARLSWLALLALGFPITWMFPIMYTRNYILYFSPLPVGFFERYPMPEWIVYGAGMVWLLGVGWLVGNMKILSPRKNGNFI
ncbi:MAG TPA: hypothetical protein PK530_02210 [Anaerolineales bacterium]|nr:hypothetical protein [Anaerolineales bacterium]